jgi:hypothetical protein
MLPRDEFTTARQAAVARALAGVERKFGVGALRRLGDLAQPVADVLPTGRIDLD